MEELATYTAFRGWQRVGSGGLAEVLRAVVEGSAAPAEGLLMFEDRSGKQVDFDLRGSADEVIERAGAQPVRVGPGRPKLGVTSREVSLLPRHWQWLETQPQGASAALRRLVDAARSRDSGEAETRQAMDAVGRVMTAMAGNLTGFEDAYRALYARDREKFAGLVAEWPEDLRAWVLGRLGSAG